MTVPDARGGEPDLTDQDTADALAASALGRPKRRVLMFLYFFPPLGGVSMSRNVRNVQHLPRYGWLPTVVTPRDPGYEIRDPGALALIPDEAPVLRTRSIEAGHVRAFLAPLVRRLRAHLEPSRPVVGHRRGAVGADGRTSSRSGAAASDPAVEDAPLGLERLRRLMFFPDDRVGWLPFAVARAVAVHRAGPFDAVFSTSSPVTSHLAAGLVKRLTGVPWVAEFRDPWVGNVLAAPLPWAYRRLQVKLERWIIGSADVVVCVTPSLSRLYRDRYPGAHVVTITNGYDRTESSGRTARVRSETYEIVYTGTLDRAAEFEVFLEGVDSLVARRPDLAARLRLTFYGEVAESCRAIAARLIRDGNLGAVVRFAGFVPRRDALAAVRAADAALVLLGSGPGMELFVGGKLYDYLGQDAQILAMLPDGDARDVLDGLGWGITVKPDRNDVGRAVERLLDVPPPTGPADPSRRYDRERLAGLLAAALDDARERSIARSRNRQP